MAEKTIGALIKEARTGANLTQEQLAKKIKNLSASDISAAERGEKTLTQSLLKEIAKATGVTQASLLNAAKGSSAKSSEKKSTEKKSAEKKSTAKKTTTTKKTTTAKKTSMSVTAAEKKLVELYRKADADTQKNALNVLKGKDDDDDSVLQSIMDSLSGLLKDK